MNVDIGIYEQYALILRRQLTLALQNEANIRQDDEMAALLLPFEGRLRQRERDYRVLIGCVGHAVRLHSQGNEEMTASGKTVPSWHRCVQDFIILRRRRDNEWKQLEAEISDTLFPNC